MLIRRRPNRLIIRSLNIKLNNRMPIYLANPTMNTSSTISRLTRTNFANQNIRHSTRMLNNSSNQNIRTPRIKGLNTTLFRSNLANLPINLRRITILPHSLIMKISTLNNRSPLSNRPQQLTKTLSNNTYSFNRKLTSLSIKLKHTRHKQQGIVA